MERLKSNVNTVFTLILALMSIVGLVLYKCGYKFKPANYTVFAVIVSALFIGAVVFNIVFRKYQSKASKTFGIHMPLFTVLFVIPLYLSIECEPIYVRWGYLSPFFLVTLLEIPAAVMFLMCLRGKWLKIIFGILIAIAACFIGRLMFIVLIFSSIGITTLESEHFSPDKTYIALVETSDQGALGGDVLVYARNERKEKNILIGSIKDTDSLVKMDNWGTEMDVSWQDNKNLIINGEIYNIPRLLGEDQ